MVVGLVCRLVAAIGRTTGRGGEVANGSHPTGMCKCQTVQASRVPMSLGGDLWRVVCATEFCGMHAAELAGALRVVDAHVCMCRLAAHLRAAQLRRCMCDASA